jgi:predicted unusual protein kinase regulating ubiquinone biosynthesis (AarF/ABC1/UbiB family)
MSEGEDGKRPDAPPTSRWGRLARLGALGTKALPLATQAVKRALVGNAPAPDEAALAKEREEVQKTAKKAAEAMLKTLGEMKGLPLKLGQMASYVEGLAPPGYEERFQEALKSLQSKAPPLSAEAARKVIRAELGDEPEALFATFEADPFAAASIGQVHRATTKGGAKVAVKVQYPGIDKAIENDLKSIGLLEQMMAPVARKYHTKETLDEIRAVFMAELDYGREARRADVFRSIFVDDPNIVIPKIHHALTTKRVLTMDFQEGIDFASYCASASQDDRNASGETIWRFMFRALYGYGLLYADPHPGNYRFLGGGKVAFLDFGCVKVMPPDLVAGMKALVTSVMDKDETEFYRVCVEVLGYDPTDEEAFRVFVGYTRMLMQPFTQVPYRHTRDAAREAVAFLVRNGKGVVFKEGEALPNLPKPIHMPKDHTFVNRLQWGLSSIMAGLDCVGDYRALTEPMVRGPLELVDPDL